MNAGSTFNDFPSCAFPQLLPPEPSLSLWLLAVATGLGHAEVFLFSVPSALDCETLPSRLPFLDLFPVA